MFPVSCLGLLLLAFGHATAPGEVGFAELVARGDAAWDGRAEGAQGAVAAPGPIAEAVAAYEEALRLQPDDLGLRRRLLRALRFQGAYVPGEKEARVRIYQRGTEVFAGALEGMARASGQESLAGKEAKELGDILAGIEEAGELYFWGAVHWGAWADLVGAMPALREGVAERLRRYSEAAIELDETCEAAGGLRFLGRFHAVAPKVPLFTGWVDRDLAVTLLERAYALAPEHLENQLFLVEVWLARRPEEKPEALDLLRRLLASPPRPAMLVEDRAVLEAAAAFDSSRR